MMAAVAMAAIVPDGVGPSDEHLPLITAPLERLADTPLMEEIIAYLDVPSIARLTHGVSRRLAESLRPQRHLWTALRRRLGLVVWEGEPIAGSSGGACCTDDDMLADVVRRWRYNQALLRPPPLTGRRRRRRRRSPAPEEDPRLPERAWRFLPLMETVAPAGGMNTATEPLVVWDREDMMGLVAGTTPRLAWIHPLTHHVMVQSLVAPAKGEILLDANAFHAEDDLPSHRRRPGLDMHVRYVGLEVASRLGDGAIPQVPPAVVGADVCVARCFTSLDSGPRVAVMDIRSWFLPAAAVGDRAATRLGPDDSGSLSRVQFENDRFWSIMACSRRQILCLNRASEFAGGPIVELFAFRPKGTGGTDQATTSGSNGCQPALAVAQLEVREPVQIMAACPSSDLVIICTSRAGLQIWNVSQPVKPVLEVHLSMREALSKMLRNRHALSSHDIFQHTIDAILVAKHLPIHISGFVTLQFEYEEHCSVALWRRSATSPVEDDTEQSFQPVSVILLPVSASRKPRLHFDGRRLIAYAQDHIGLLVLVYHVRLNGEDDILFQNIASHEIGVQEDGSVYNLTNPPNVRLANLLRHDLLDGIESYENLHMTCNERFLVFNCRRPHESGDAWCEGLAVIDLDAALEGPMSTS